MSQLPETLSLPSGAQLTMSHAPFSSAMKLFKTVARELKDVSLGLKMDITVTDPSSLAKLMGQDLPLDLIKNALCQMVASDAIEQALQECMGRCLYAGQSISKGTFEDPKARGDYLVVAWEVMKLNLLPFFSSLPLKSLAPPSPTGDSQK